MIIDNYIPDDLKRNFDTLYKARVLFSIIITYSVLLIFIETWLFFVADISEPGKLFGSIILICMLIGYFLAAAITHYQSWYILSSHITVATTALGIASGIVISGGPIYAPATAMNILPIIMAFVLIGKRAGLVWTQIILTIHIGFMVGIAYGLKFTQLLTPDMLPTQHLAHWLITYTAMIGLMFVFDTLNSRLKAERDAERQKFEHLASHDPLTNLANRLQFDISLNKSMNRGDRHKKMTALFFIDLDGFKPINDTLGHDAGDEVLKEMATRLEANVRTMDTVARLGGDEFGVIFEDIDDTQKLTEMAEKILAIINKPIKQLAEHPSISGSIGISIYPLHTKSKEELIKFSDIAMYEAKKTKNSWAFYSRQQVLPHLDQ
jgi:diguanylate cyclase (GGDEF)-like protein